jgi:hypothetical protein
MTGALAAAVLYPILLSLRFPQSTGSCDSAIARQRVEEGGCERIAAGWRCRWLKVSSVVKQDYLRGNYGDTYVAPTDLVQVLAARHAECGEDQRCIF